MLTIPVRAYISHHNTEVTVGLEDGGLITAPQLQWLREKLCRSADCACFAGSVEFHAYNQSTHTWTDNLTWEWDTDSDGNQVIRVST